MKINYSTDDKADWPRASVKVSNEIHCPHCKSNYITGLKIEWWKHDEVEWVCRECDKPFIIDRVFINTDD
jgi:transposase-like protein